MRLVPCVCKVMVLGVIQGGRESHARPWLTVQGETGKPSKHQNTRQAAGSAIRSIWKATWGPGGAGREVAAGEGRPHNASQRWWQWTQTFMAALDLLKEEGKGKTFPVDITIRASTLRWGSHREV